MRIFGEMPRCAVTSQLILQSHHHGVEDKSLARVRPDYSIFSSPEAHPVYQKALSKGCDFLVSKEELGHEFSKGECGFGIFPDAAAYNLTRPAFLVRDPIRVFDSWKKMGWNDLYGFLICYRSFIKALHESPDPKPIIYEDLISDPRQTVARLAEYWNIPFDENCLEFKKPFGDFIYKDDRVQSIYHEAGPEWLFNRVKSYGHIEDFSGHGLISASEIEHIENEVGNLYLKAHGPRLDGIRATLSSKKWVGFDLDDTLHEFRKASGHASSSVFKAIVDENPAISTADLASTYSEILRPNTASAFTDGRTSEDYRKERFVNLFQAHSLEPNKERVDHLLKIYRDSLRTALRLKAGAAQLL